MGGDRMPIETVAASEEGGKRRRAEYVILKILNEEGALHIDELESGVKTLHMDLIGSDVTTPFYFRGGGSNGPVSREFDSSINRLLQFDRIRLNDDNEYIITQQGILYLSDAEKLERHSIDDGFRSAVEESVNRL